MAVGKSYEAIVLGKLSVSMGGVAIAAGDGPVEGYDESENSVKYRGYAR
jgi:hypothetical protein